MDFIKIIEAELSLMSDSDIMEVSDDPVQKSETVLGTVPVKFQKLYTMSRNLAKRSATLAVESSFNEDRDKKAEARAEAHKLRQKADLMKDLFWYGLREKFNVWDKAIGFRGEWKVVSYESGGNPIEKLLGGMLGGMSE